jgi:hypothetical protein
MEKHDEVAASNREPRALANHATSPTDAREDRSVSMGRANVWTLLVLGPAVVILTAGFVLLHGWWPLALSGLRLLPVALLAVAAGVLAHEVLHLLAWKVAAGLPWSDVRLGFQWRTLTPYAHARSPMSARAYRIGAVTPGVILGLVPVALGLAMASGAWFLFGLLFTFAAGGDALILYLLRGVPPDSLVSDHPERAGCYVTPRPASESA